MTDAELIKELRSFSNQERSGDSGDWIDALHLMESAAMRLEELTKGGDAK